MKELTGFEKDCGALLELAQEIAVKYEKDINLTIISIGAGTVFNRIQRVCSIGYFEPTNMARFK